MILWSGLHMVLKWDCVNEITVGQPWYVSNFTFVHHVSLRRPLHPLVFRFHYCVHHFYCYTLVRDYMCSSLTTLASHFSECVLVVVHTCILAPLTFDLIVQDVNRIYYVFACLTLQPPNMNGCENVKLKKMCLGRSGHKWTDVTHRLVYHCSPMCPAGHLGSDFVTVYVNITRRSKVPNLNVCLKM